MSTLGRKWSRERKDADDSQVGGQKLYISRITEGSIEVDLVALGHQGWLLGSAALASISQDPSAALGKVNDAVDFVRNLKGMVDYFLKRGERPKKLTSRDCDEIHNIVSPISPQSTGGLQILVTGNSTFNLSINTLEANTIQNRAAQEKILIREPTETTFKSVPFYWHQAESGPARTTGSSPDKGVIEASGSVRPLKILFNEDGKGLKERMVGGEENPFSYYWIVDAEAIVVEGRFIACKIIDVVDKIHKNLG